MMNEKTEFIDWSGSGWTIDKIIEISEKLKTFADEKGYEDVKIVSVEDNTWSDAKNERYDVWITLTKSGTAYEQKLLILKGEVLDAMEFHKRHGEFY